MTTIDLLPLKGIIIKNFFSKTLIEIGESEKSVITKLGKPKKIVNHDEDKKTYYYHKNNLQLEFNGELLKAIQIGYDLCNNILLSNINVLKLDCDALITELSVKYGCFKEDFNKTQYSNFNHSIGFRRPLIPEDIEEDLGENDYQKGVFFSSVVIGEKGYFNE